MNFGRELQDFIAGFDAGWGMVNRREEREWEREQRQMAREDHARVRERDRIGDEQWERNFGFREREFNYRQGRDAIRDDQWERDFDAREHQRGIGNVHTETRLGIERDRLNRGVIDDYTGGGLDPDDQHAVDSFDTWFEGSTDSDVESRHASLITNESGGNWRAQNDARGHGGQVGHFGRLQFGQARLQDAKNAGVLPADVTPQQFMNSPDLQRAVENWHFSDIDRQAERLGLTRYIGQEIGGVRISPDAIRAMAHLGGINGAKRFIESGGSYNPADRNGTRLSDYGRRHGGQRTAHMARGGLVPDDEDEEFIATPSFGQDQAAIPDGSMPEPRYAQADGQSLSGQTEHIVDPYERGVQAALDGLRRAQELARINTQDVLDTPEVQQAREAYLRGYGAAPQQIVRQAQDRIDPERTMPASERNIRAIGAAWQYFMDMGEYDKAQEVAASMVQAMRQEEQKLAAVAAAAAEEGDIDTAAKAAVAAYANVPNGLDLDVQPNEDGSYSVSIVEQRSRDVVSEQTMSPREIAAMAMNVDLGGFDEWILNAAGMVGQRYETASHSDTRANELAVSEAVEMQLADADLTQKQMGDIRDISMGIANLNQGVAPAAAVSFVIRLFEPIQTTNEDGEVTIVPNFKIDTVPDDPSIRIVTSGGQQVAMSVNEANLLQQSFEGVANARRAAHEAERRHSEYWGGVVDKGLQTVKDFGAALLGNTVPGMIMDNVTAVPVEDSDQPAANPYGAAIPEAGNEDTEAEIQQLLTTREQMLANPELRSQNNNYDRVLQHIEDRLRELGYTEPQ